jgi:hypothetical protein
MGRSPIVCSVKQVCSHRRVARRPLEALCGPLTPAHSVNCFIFVCAQFFVGLSHLLLEIMLVFRRNSDLSSEANVLTVFFFIAKRNS